MLDQPGRVPREAVVRSEESKMSSSRPEQKRQSDQQDAYQPPCLTVLGTVAAITQGAANPGGDIVFSNGVVSDRQLKDQLRPVDTCRVLAGVAALSL
jgi:hypothetical protein